MLCQVYTNNLGQDLEMDVNKLSPQPLLGTFAFGKNIATRHLFNSSENYTDSFF